MNLGSVLGGAVSGFLTGGPTGAIVGCGMALLNGVGTKGGTTGGGGATAAGGSGAAGDPAAELSSTFDRAIETQKKLQEVQITKQPFLDAAKEKPR